MTHTSLDSKAHHHGVHADDFLNQVRMLKEAEKSAQQVLDSAKQRAAGIEAAARERAVEAAASAEEKAVQVKNDIFAKGRGETDKEIASIIGDAKKQAEKISAKRLSDKDVSALSQGVL